MPSLDVHLNYDKIKCVQKYEYLGVIVDKNLSYKVNLEITYKKAMSRTKLLTRIRQNLTPYAAESIYKVMIRPLFLYCNSLMLGSKSFLHKSQAIQDRAYKIVFNQNRSNKWNSIQSLSNKLTALEVFDCLNENSPDLFHGWFHKMNHQSKYSSKWKRATIARCKN